MRFLLGYTSIDSLNHFIDEIDLELKRLGHQTYIADFCNVNNRQLSEFCSNPVDGAILLDMAVLDRDYYDMRNIPVVNILVDHPMTFTEVMLHPPKRYIQFSTDENHVSYSKRFYHIQHSYFLPHIGTIPPTTGGQPLEKRKHQILFPGSYVPYNTFYQKIKSAQISDEIKMLYMETLEQMLDCPENTLEYAFEKCLKDRNIELNDEIVAQILANGKDLDWFVRMYYRYKTVSQIVREGYPLRVVGSGWEQTNIEEFPNAEILSPRNFSEIFPLMEDARITLNVMPWFKAGSHDRIFDSLLRGSCPLTDESSWLIKNFVPEKDTVYYTLDKLEKLPDIIENLLYDDERLYSVIQNGCKKVLQNYTRIQIVSTILEYLKKV